MNSFLLILEWKKIRTVVASVEVEVEIEWEGV